MTKDPSPASADARIRGIYELGHALYALDADSHGFARSDIEQVECFWSYSDMHSSSAGFVLRLHDGRRAHVDFLHWHGFEQDEDFRIEVEFLPRDQVHPTFPSSPDRAPWPPGGWSSGTSHLNRMLAR
jgi:hypothetical protein